MGNNSVTSFSGRRITLVVLGFVLLVTIVVAGLLVDFLNKQELVRKDQQLQDAQFLLTSHQLAISEVVLQAETRLFHDLAAQNNDISSLRLQSRLHPLIRQMFVVNDDGSLIYPNERENLSEQEQQFIQRTRALWENKEFNSMLVQEAYETRQHETSAASGWFSWYATNHLIPIYWVRVGNRFIGAELNSARMLSDVILALPENELFQAGYTVRLVNIGNQTLYQWGDEIPLTQMNPVAELSLRPPLNGWRLQITGAPPQSSSPQLVNQIAILAFICFELFLVAMAFYVISMFRRAASQAQQRVTFVNQVSHELKTPLTNIQLYTDLLQDNIDPDDSQSEKYITVVKQETNRLSRLIANVLNLARSDNDKLMPQRTNCNMQALIDQLELVFQPLYAKKGLTLVTKNTVSSPVNVDCDMVEQILTNLLSNAEKYVDSGNVQLHAQLTNNTLLVDVIDEGDGVQASQHQRVFDPFYRVSNKLTDGVSGTGIGLSISRSLAQAQQGDLEILPTEKGAHFRLSIPQESQK